MQRAKLEEALKLAAPGLSKGAVGGPPAWRCFQFEGERVRAFNGLVAVDVPLPGWSAEGAVDGAKLLAFVRASKGEEVAVSTTKGGGMRVRIGSGAMTLPMFNAEDLGYKEPAAVGSRVFDIDAAIFGAINRVQFAMQSGNGVRAFDGVTLVVADGEVRAYATDSKRMIRVVREYKPKKKTKPVTLLLPPDFVDMLVTHARPTEDACAKLTVGSDALKVELPDGTKIVAAQLAVNGTVEDEYEGIITQNSRADQAVEIPAGIEDAIKQCRIAIDGPESKIDVKVRAGALELRGSGISVVRTKVAISDDHPDCSVVMLVDPLLDAVGRFSKMILPLGDDAAATFVGTDGAVCILSRFTESQKEDEDESADAEEETLD